MNYMELIVNNLAKRKKRNALTILAIVIGITAVVALMSIGYGLQVTINEQFELMGVDKLMIMPGGAFFGFAGGGASELTEHDMDTVQDVDGIKVAGAMIYKVARVEYKGETKYTYVSGIPTDETREIIDSMQSFSVIEGRDLKDGDGNTAIAGYLITNDGFFEKTPSVGDSITIEDTKFKIVGSINRIGTYQDDTQFLIPLDAAKDLYNEYEKIDIIIAQTREGFDPGDVAEDVKEALRKDRELEKGEEDFTVQTSEQLMDTFAMIFDLVILVVIGIAGISLLVGGVGIMNTMYMSILERTREIGIMKSIGATSHNVLIIFLVESGILGLVGGAIGCGLGMLIAKGLEVVLEGFFTVKAYMGLELVAGAMIFSLFIGVIAGLLPARRAARLNPVDALRYE